MAEIAVEKHIGDKLPWGEIVGQNEVQAQHVDEIGAAAAEHELCQKNDTVDYQQILCYWGQLFEHTMSLGINMAAKLLLLRRLSF